MQTRRKLLLKFTSIAAAAAICSCALYPYGGTLGAPPLNAFSVDSETDVVFDESDGTLYLYGDFKKSDVQAYSGNDAVKGVIAGEYAKLPADSSGLFQGFRYAKKIVLDYADFSIVSDMSSMFSECESLEKLELETFETGAVTDMSSMFSGCKALKELNIKSFDTAKVTDMSGMFLACSSLESLDLSNFDTSAVTDMSKMFSNCNALKELNIKSFDTAQVTNMSTMFYGCSGLKSMDLSSFDTARVTNMSTMFYGCSGLNGIDLSSFDTAAVTDMSGMFACCDSLTDLDLTGFDTSRVQKMGMMFYLDGSLSSITVSRKWDISSLVPEDGLESDYTFDGCTSLVGGAGTVYDSSMIDSGYARIDGGAENPGYLTAAAEPCVRFDEATGTLYLSGRVDSDEVQTYAKNEAVLHVVAEEGTVFQEYSGDVFLNFYYVQTIDLSKADTTEVYTMDSMFRNCRALTELDLSSFNTSGVLTMFDMFKDCGNLSRITVSDLWDNSLALGNSKSMFEGCTVLVGGSGTVYDAEHTDGAYAHIDGGAENPGYLTAAEAASSCVRFDEATGTLYLSGNVVLDEVRTYANNEAVLHVVAEEGTVFPESCDEMFKNFYSTETMDLSKADTSLVKSMGWMFSCCYALTSLDLSNFNTSGVLSMYQMFKECYRLTSLDLSSFDTSSSQVFEEMFKYCEQLKTIIVSSEWYVDPMTSSSGWMFEGCEALVGGSGTVYDAKHDADYAHIDGGAENPGYLTAPAEPCVRFDEATGTLYLSGNVVLDEVRAYAENEAVKHIVAEEGTVFPKDCYNLFFNFYYVQTMDLSKADTSQVTNMRSMFHECSSIRELDISSFDTSHVTDMFAMFAGCLALEKLNLSGFDTRNVTDMRSMFGDCYALEQLDISSFDTANVNYMNGMFKQCDALKTITVGDKWSTASVTGSDAMFELCKALVGGSGTVYDKNHIDAAYAQIDGGEKNPGYLTAAPAEPCVRFDAATGTLYLSGNVVLDEVRAYANNDAVLHVVAEEGTVFPRDCRDLFAGFSFAETMDLANADTGNVSAMGELFFGCKNLTELDLSSFNTSNVTSMAGMFKGCSSLTALDLSSFDTSKVVSMDVMFRECSALPAVDVTGFVTSSLRSMPGMFYDCTAMTVLDLSSFDTSKAKDMIKLFFNCSSLETIIVSDAWNTDSVNFCDNMFEGCTSLSGSKGTVYDAEHIDVLYAHIDGGAENPGYLTAKTDKYSISFDANGGAGSMESVEITAGEAFTLPECGFTAPTYHKFTGWIVGGAQKQPGDTVTLHADTVLTASWDYALITVTFDANGGEGSFVDMTLLSGAMFVFPVCEFLAPEGKTFAGWQYGEMTAQPGDHTVFETDMTVKAIWTDLSDTILIGDVNGDGTVDSGDEMLLSRYVGAWAGIELELAAADLDRDGKVDIRDAMILSRYVAGWEGYDQYIIEIQK